MNQSVTVIARVRAKSGKEKELREVLLGLVAPTRAEAGCLNYDLHESVDRPGLFFFYENWTNPAEMARHFETLHVKEALKKAETLLAEPLEIQNLSLISRPEFKPKAGVSARSGGEK